MRALIFRKDILAAFLMALLCSSPAIGLDTAFSYQARLDDGGSPANGTYDFRFFLYDAEAGGSQVGSTIYGDDIVVTDGLFTVYLDFGPGTFDGADLWLDIAVRPGGSVDVYTPLVPRQAIMPSPYALHSGTIEIGAVGSAEVADNSLTANDLAPNSVGASEIATGAVGTSELGTGAVTSLDILDNSITTSDILNGTITYSDTNVNSVQRRVASSCPAGYSIRAISNTGSVTCEIDNDIYNNIHHTGKYGTSSTNGVNQSIYWYKVGTDSICFLTKSYVRETDSGSEFAECQISEEATRWRLAANTLGGNDNDVGCAMHCIYWYKY